MSNFERYTRCRVLGRLDKLRIELAVVVFRLKFKIFVARNEGALYNRKLTRVTMHLSRNSEQKLQDLSVM